MGFPGVFLVFWAHHLKKVLHQPTENTASKESYTCRSNTVKTSGGIWMFRVEWLDKKSILYCLYYIIWGASQTIKHDVLHTHLQVSYYPASFCCSNLILVFQTESNWIKQKYDPPGHQKEELEFQQRCLSILPLPSRKWMYHIPPNGKGNT